MDLEKRAQELAEDEKNLPQEKSSQLPQEGSAGFSLNALQEDFLKKQIAAGKSLSEITSDFAKSLITSDILQGDNPEAEKFRKELAEQQKDTLKEGFKKDNETAKSETIEEKQKKAEAFYKAFRPILEFDFDNLIKKKSIKNKNNKDDKKEVEDKPVKATYQDRSYGICLMVVMLILLTVPYCLVTISLALFNGLNALLEEINTFGRIARYIVLGVLGVIFTIIFVYALLRGVENVFNLQIFPK